MGAQEQGAPIAVRYSMTMDDIVAFNEYHMLASPTALRKRAKLLKILTSIFAVEFGLIGFLLRGLILPGNAWWSWLFPPLLAIAGGSVAYFILRASFNRRKPRLPGWMRNRIRKLYSEGENKSILGDHVLEASESGFSNRTAYNESRYAWGALERVETTAEHTFLFVGAINAVVIPHNQITDGSLPDFLRAIRTHYKPHQRLDTEDTALLK